MLTHKYFQRLGIPAVVKMISYKKTGQIFLLIPLYLLCL